MFQNNTTISDGRNAIGYDDSGSTELNMVHKSKKRGVMERWKLQCSRDFRRTVIQLTPIA